MKWRMQGFRTQWRKRWTYGYSEPESYIAILQQWTLMWRGYKLWTKYTTVGEIPVWQWCARATVGDCVLTAEQYEEFSKITPTNQPA
jgi:hypothetical protein